MINELEIAAQGSVGSFTRGAAHEHAAAIDAPCANCATPLKGPWCHACGQSAEDFHRSVVRLCGEVVEGLLHFDGRLWRTLPDLMIRPARLTRNYLEGHRAPQIPPLRLFLVVLLGVFVVGGIVGGASKVVQINATKNGEGGKRPTTVIETKSFNHLTPEERAKISSHLDDIKVSIGGDKPNAQATQWLKDRLVRTLADPERFQLIVEQWSERFAILMLPVSALLLSLLFIFKTKFFLFDHTIFSLHSLSAVGLMLILSMAVSPAGKGWSDLFMLPIPVHLFFHMRGVYRTSILGTLIRMFLLFAGSVVAAALLVVGLVAVGLNGMGD